VDLTFLVNALVVHFLAQVLLVADVRLFAVLVSRGAALAPDLVALAEPAA